MTEKRTERPFRSYVPIPSDIPFTHALPPGMSEAYYLRTRGAPMLRAGMSTAPEQQFTAAQGRDIIKAADRTHDYITDNRIKNVVLLDRNARPTEVALYTVWSHQHPREPRPYSTFFLNTRGFLTPEDLASESQASEKGRAGKEFKTAVLSGDYVQEQPAGRTRNEIQRDLERSTPYLFAAREEPTLVFDVCMHEGASMGAVLRELDASGFTDLRLGLAGDRTNSSAISPDFVALPESDEMTCGLFGTDRMTVKPYTSVLAQSNPDRSERYASRHLRQTLRETIYLTAQTTQIPQVHEEPKVGESTAQSIGAQEASGRENFFGSIQGKAKTK